MNDNNNRTHVYRIFVKATAQAIWDAITTPEWTTKWGYRTPVSYDLRTGGQFSHPANAVMKQHGVPDIAAVGEVLEARPPSRLVQTWRACWLPEEPATTLTYEIAERGEGVCELIVTHQLAGAPRLEAMVDGKHENAGGGWWETLSDLKSLLETGAPLRG